MKKKIGFYISHGVEVRHFILSGLYEKAHELYDPVILMKKDVHSEFLGDYLELDKIHYLNFGAIKMWHWGQGYLTSIRKARLRLKRIGNFHNYNEVNNTIRLKDYLLGNRIVFNLTHKLFSGNLEAHYTDELLKKDLEKLDLSVVFMLDYSAPFHMQLGYTANKAGIAVKCIVNTLKTYYINDFVPFKAQKVYTWNQQQSDLFQKSNPHLSPGTFINAGNPFHAYILKPAVTQPVGTFFSQLKDRPYIVYSLIYEGIYDGEYEIIKRISEYLDLRYADKAPYLVLRRNPFETPQFDLKRFKNLKNVLIAPHYWERKPEEEWSIQGLSGEQEWKYLLANAQLMMNITSMAAVEAILSGTPVINIGFNGEGVAEPAISRFAHAPFLEDILSSPYVKRAMNWTEFETEFEVMYTVKSAVPERQIQNSLAITVFEASSLDTMLVPQ